MTGEEHVEKYEAAKDSAIDAPRRPGPRRGASADATELCPRRDASADATELCPRRGASLDADEMTPRSHHERVVAYHREESLIVRYH